LINPALILGVIVCFKSNSWNSNHKYQTWEES